MRFAEPRLFALGLSLLAIAAASVLECVIGLDISETAVFIASAAAFLVVWLVTRVIDRFANRDVRTDV
ncbi:hypothetical protein ACLBX9_27460 [Methylobacterium sp. A49B]|uniref:Uncharacterized protein n=1 Tax=Methylobacterium mesophilicum SR1.6/6 TaxID=908290 RepID=A0A6B9FQE9_9HYPH|nr:hypothetical protein [Methylobacterium mesophilicum]QGY04079.1 hypothetical protein MMSR116_20865 [Methylobacterium mesophilicum SR1.6/6]